MASYYTKLKEKRKKKVNWHWSYLWEKWGSRKGYKWGYENDKNDEWMIMKWRREIKSQWKRGTLHSNLCCFFVAQKWKHHNGNIDKDLSVFFSLNLIFSYTVPNIFSLQFVQSLAILIFVWVWFLITNFLVLVFKSKFSSILDKNFP